MKFQLGFILLAVIALVGVSCERDVADLDPPTYPSNGDVFIDGFSGGLAYSADGNSLLTAFDVDDQEAYQGTASMRFDIPNASNPDGGYAGGVFTVEGGRDLTSYNVLTFWAKASKGETINSVGFGLTYDETDNDVYQVELKNAPVGTNWQKYYIPIPDPAKLTMEKGLFWYSEGSDDGTSYSLWIDEVKFESLEGVGQIIPSIYDGQDFSTTAETGDEIMVPSSVSTSISTLTATNAINVTVSVAPAYFDFASSETSVATVNDQGTITVLDEGTSVITASLNGVAANGSLTVESTGDPILPLTAAPTPPQDAGDVISLYSNQYPNVPVEFFNGFWEFSTTQNTEVQVDGDDIIRYTMLNFVGIQFTEPTIDASAMTHLHLDIWTPDATSGGQAFRVLLVDIGPDDVLGTGDDSSQELTFTTPTLQTEQWVSLDIPFSDFTGITSFGNLAQIVLSGDIPNVFLDNLYFHADGGGSNTPTLPSMAAPAPTQDANNVISIYSDAYTNVDGTNLNPDWGQATVMTEESVDGNNIIQYAGLNYQGIELASSLDVSGMDFLHLDVWTENSTALNAFLISTGPVETGSAITVPTSGWSSIDIPLSNFSPVDLADIIQMKFDGNGDIFLDNIYFYADGPAPTMPTTAAPTPTLAAEDVISVFSDAYMDIAGTNLNPNWDQTTVVNEIDVAGNNTLEYKTFDYQGIELGSTQDLSGMDFLHVDFWTTNASDLNIYLVDGSTNETAVSLNVPTNGWGSTNISLADFTGVDLTDVIQIKFDGGTGVEDVYIDNIYFYLVSSSGSNGCSTGNLVPAAALPVDFEGCETFPAELNFAPYEGGITSEIAPNPFPGGINTSSYALKIVKGPSDTETASWAGVQNNFASNFDLNATPTFKMKIYSSKPNVDFRFEVAQDDNMIGNPAPVVVNVPNANEWTEVSFSFENIPAPTAYFRLVIKPDNDLDDTPLTSEGTYYIDDITLE